MSTGACPEWCINAPCDLEHWANPGGAEWPAARASPEVHGKTMQVVPHPAWCEMDGCAPEVALYVQTHRDDTTFSYTPEAAEALAAQILRAAAAARSSQMAPTA